MKRSLLFGVVLAFVVVAMAFAQGKPNFSGKWTPEQAAAAAEQGRGRGMGGGPMTVTQTDKTLTIERTMGETTMKTVYNLDGTETKNEVSRGGQTMTQMLSAKWDGSKLLLTTKSEGPSGPMERTQTWSLSAEGKLQVEQPGQGGNVRTTIYTKG